MLCFTTGAYGIYRIFSICAAFAFRFALLPFRSLFFRPARGTAAAGRGGYENARKVSCFRADIVVENHSLDEWFERSLLAIMRPPFAIIEVRSANCTKKKQREVKHEP